MKPPLTTEKPFSMHLLLLESGKQVQYRRNKLCKIGLRWAIGIFPRSVKKNYNSSSFVCFAVLHSVFFFIFKLVFELDRCLGAPRNLWTCLLVSSSWVILVGMMVETRNAVRLAPPTPHAREATHAASAASRSRDSCQHKRWRVFFCFVFSMSQWVTKEEWWSFSWWGVKETDVFTDVICRLTSFSFSCFQSGLTAAPAVGSWMQHLLDSFEGGLFKLLPGQKSDFSGLAERMQRVCWQTASVSLPSAQTSDYFFRMRVSMLTVDMERNLPICL